ncbi:hypothetical protein HWV62_16216 [Athelia sp. TMB]|nr:hypothetical protein HWV62_16216 [Athelia sp. TMB]
MAQVATIPCQYRTGETLGSGTYAIVKEAIHIKTGKYYACKIINKKLMQGREHVVRNEIAVLKKVSGGELFYSICAEGYYYEADAAALIRTIFEAVAYIHDCGIVHRDLKPENLLFRTKAVNAADIMITDFGLSRVMDDSKLSLLTEVCGTPGYMAPEIFKKTGHGKPVDVWAMGVIVYFLLAGYTPFGRDTQEEETQAIISGDYAFEPEEDWSNVSDTARSFVAACLAADPTQRPTARQALQHKWLASEMPHFVPDPDQEGRPTDLLPHVQKAFHARRTFRKAAIGMMAVHRMSTLASSHLTAEQRELNDKVSKMKEESAKEDMENATIVHHHDHCGEEKPCEVIEKLNKIDVIAEKHTAATELVVQKVSATSLEDKSKSTSAT